MCYLATAGSSNEAGDLAAGLDACAANYVFREFKTGASQVPLGHAGETVDGIWPARQAGRRTTNSVPRPISLEHEMPPPWLSTIQRVTASPSPAPPCSRARVLSAR